MKAADSTRPRGSVSISMIGVGLVPLLVAAWAALIYAPEEATMGQVQRIFYFHVPSAWVAGLAFAVLCVSSIAYLRTRQMHWDVVALSASEIGLLFTTLALITGSLWAKPAWGTWWTWEPRLTTTFVLWLIYASYLLVRGAIPQPSQRATFAAVIGIVGFIDVPIVFGSIRWWRSVHPIVVSGNGFDMERPMFIALLICLVAFTILFAALLRLRVALETARNHAERLTFEAQLRDEEEA